MDFSTLLAILSRWVHIVTACITVGGVFFMRVIVPIGLSRLEPESTRMETMLRLRRAFKMTIHSAILLFLLSGIYNTWLKWPEYSLDRASMHGLWGMHLLLGLIFFGIALYLLAGPALREKYQGWMTVNLIILLTTIAVAGVLKVVRERAVLKAERERTTMPIDVGAIRR